MYRIFIVEDDPIIAGALQKRVEAWGYSARCASDFRGVLAEYAAFQPHLTLLDIMLPYYNGFYWCAEIRKASTAPIVFISSAADNMNIVMAMNMGGDDFVVKPFDLNVLTAKIQAILRRAYDFTGAQNIIAHEGALINLLDASVTYEGMRAELTKNELKIMETLLKRKGEVVSREALMEALWQSESFVDENTLSVNVARLRRKLESLHLGDMIETKKGMGYLVSKGGA